MFPVSQSFYSPFEFLWGFNVQDDVCKITGRRESVFAGFKSYFSCQGTGVQPSRVLHWPQGVSFRKDACQKQKMVRGLEEQFYHNWRAFWRVNIIFLLDKMFFLLLSIGNANCSVLLFLLCIFYLLRFFRARISCDKQGTTVVCCS